MFDWKTACTATLVTEELFEEDLQIPSPVIPSTQPSVPAADAPAPAAADATSVDAPATAPLDPIAQHAAFFEIVLCDKALDVVPPIKFLKTTTTSDKRLINYWRCIRFAQREKTFFNARQIHTMLADAKDTVIHTHVFRLAGFYHRRVMEKIKEYTFATFKKPILPPSLHKTQSRLYKSDYVSFESALSLATITLASKYLSDVAYCNRDYFDFYVSLSRKNKLQYPGWGLHDDIATLEEFNEFLLAVLFLLDFSLGGPAFPQTPLADAPARDNDPVRPLPMEIVLGDE